MAKKLYRDRTLSIPEICKTLNISKATLYRWVNAGGGNVAKP
jgi:excisionase family DNA binding protein